MTKKNDGRNALALDLSNTLAAAVETTGEGVVRVEGRRRRPSSGVIWDKGVVVTAEHTLEWDEEIEVGLPGGETATARLIGRDAGTDLAALEVVAKGLAAPRWIETDGVKVGHLVLGLS